MVITANGVSHLVDELEHTLTEFIRIHGITHAEYRQATNLIIASVKAGEESLLFDVFLEAASVDVDNARHRGTAEAIEGPFYMEGAPILEHPHHLPQRANEAGDVLIFTGRVIDIDGEPIGYAELDIWQADATGHYSNIQYSDTSNSIPKWNLRGRLTAAADGRFTVKTILPPPYEIPKRGPTGAVLTAIGRHVYRPAHLHVKVRHRDHREVTVQLYFRGGRYLDSDVAHAVRDALIVDLEPTQSPVTSGELASTKWVTARYDFVMERAELQT